MYEISTARVPVKVWSDPDHPPDDATLEQTRHLADLPFAHSHVALMPDAHVGYGMPIGGVLAALGQVIPHAVGLDIGCGVRAWRTNVMLGEFLAVRDAVLSDIQRSIPTGFDWHKGSQEDRTSLFDDVPDVLALRAEIEKAKKQVGTLGGGNHFIEVQRDPDDVVWVMVHSGSRNVGKQMAEHYDRLAKDLNRVQGSLVPSEWGLAHLSTRVAAGQEYISVMDWCLRFAKENRRLLQESVQRAFARRFSDVRPEPEIDVHHNYAAVEEHFGQEVVVHRKGAVRAVGRVIIPGSMGSHSYVAEGLANPESFLSCSHGAGRRMGRKQAVRSLPVEAVLAEMREKDIRLFKPKKGDVAEEATAAYKDIDEVMTQQRDLVAPDVLLLPLGVVKA